VRPLAGREVRGEIVEGTCRLTPPHRILPPRDRRILIEHRPHVFLAHRLIAMLFHIVIGTVRENVPGRPQRSRRAGGQLQVFANVARLLAASTHRKQLSEAGLHRQRKLILVHLYDVMLSPDNLDPRPLHHGARIGQSFHRRNRVAGHRLSLDSANLVHGQLLTDHEKLRRLNVGEYPTLQRSLVGDLDDRLRQ
jgi:hypothetical protein